MSDTKIDARQQELINILLSKISISDVIRADGFRIKEDDNRRITQCPFHYPLGESTLELDVEENRFSCSKCGFKGTVIGWLMYNNGLDFIEAVVELCSQYQIGWNDVFADDELVAAKRKRNSVLNRTIDQYASELKSNKEAMEYVKHTRQLDNDCLREFGIGWCTQAVVPKTPLNRMLWRYGVLGRRYTGEYFNRFSNRIVFPIRDVDGSVLGFGGRIIADTSKGAKYLNSSASYYFQKQNILYGLYETLLHSRSPGRVFLVEGYLDVIAMHQHGFKCAVAPLGTAINSTQILHLLRFTDHVSICFDVDTAGANATLKAIIQALEVMEDDQQLDVVLLPESYDPDKYLNEFGREMLKGQIKDAMPSEQWLAARAVRDSLSLRRTSRSNGERASEVESQGNIEIATKARVGKFYEELTPTISDDGVKRRHLTEAESVLGTKL